jgi:hypothetical protein
MDEIMEKHGLGFMGSMEDLWGVITGQSHQKTMKMLFPTIGKTQSDIEVALDKTSQKLVEMAEKYDLPSEVQQHGLFDPNYYGKPQSILRLALASARSQESTSIDDKEVLKVFETFYLKNLNNITEAWEDLFNRKGVEVASLNEYDRTILKFIVEKESNEFGVSFDALADKFILQPYQEVELRLSIQRLLKACKIREARTEIYRGIPFAK